MERDPGSRTWNAVELGAAANLFKPPFHVYQAVAGLRSGIQLNLETAPVVFNMDDYFFSKNFNPHLDLPGPGMTC